MYKKIHKHIHSLVSTSDTRASTANTLEKKHIFIHTQRKRKKNAWKSIKHMHQKAERNNL